MSTAAMSHSRSASSTKVWRMSEVGPPSVVS